MYCNCGSSISDWRVGANVGAVESNLCASVAKSIRREIGILYGLRGRNTLDRLLSEISINQLSRLIFVFGTYRRASGIRRYGNHKVLEIDDAHNLVLFAARLLSDWPVKFHEFLREAGEYGSSDALRHDSPRHFVMFGKALGAQFKASGLEFVVKAYRNFVVENWKGVLNRRHKWANSKHVKIQKYMPAATVARTLRISRSRVKDLVKKKILRGYVKQTANKREFFVIERSSLIGAEEYLNDHVTFSGAASLLGLPKGRVEELITGQFLTEIIDQRRAGRIRLFSRAEIARFVKRLSAASRESAEEEDLISSAVVLKTHLASESEFTALVRDILAGHLVPVDSSAAKFGFRGLSFSREEFYSWRKLLRLDSGNPHLTIVEVATHLGIKQEVAYHLVRTGILPSTESRLGKKKCRVVRLSEIDNFEQAYISSARLASLTGTSPKGIVKRMMALGIRPVVGPNIDECRQYFLKRDQVVPTLKKLTVSVPQASAMQ